MRQLRARLQQRTDARDVAAMRIALHGASSATSSAAMRYLADDISRA